MSVTTFSIAEQSPGTVTLSVGVNDHAAPTNLSVTNRVYGELSELLSEETLPVEGWVASNDGFVGYVTFTGNSGRACYAFLHKNANQKVIEAISYTAP